MIGAAQLADLESFLTPDEQAELQVLLSLDFQLRPWAPLPGPQTMAWESKADVVGFGGAAGGGKTDLAIGLALMQHQVVQMFRRDGTELSAIIDRMEQIVGHRNGLGGRPPIWRSPAGTARLVEFCSAPNLGNERKFQGRAKDLLVIDEAANFLEQQARFVMGWVRSVDVNQRCQTLMTFNPPTTSEGRWIVDFFAPWLDRKFAGPRALPGELRHVATIKGKDVWLPDGEPFVLLPNGERAYQFNPDDFSPNDIIKPQTRTFIPSRITDNPHLMGTNYMSTLQALPEPLRSQMLNGDFEAGMSDSAWQVIPTAWVDAAMDRWRERAPKGRMLGLGVDVARGGDDNTVTSARHATEDNDFWFAPLHVIPGKETPTGDTCATYVLLDRKDFAPITIDVIGVGSSAFDSIKRTGAQVVPVNVSERATRVDRTGTFTFFNLRSQLWWSMRELLDPDQDTGIALPPDNDLRAELCSVHWKPDGKVIQVEAREQVIKRIGRSPDRATAVMLAAIEVPRWTDLQRVGAGINDHDPIA